MRRFLVLIFDLMLIAVATIAAVILRDNLEVAPDHFRGLLPYATFTLLVAALTLPALRADKVVWRYSTLGDYLRLVAAAMIIVAGASVCGFFFNRLEAVPRSLPLLQGILMALALIGARVIKRVQYSGRPVTPQTERPGRRMPATSGVKKTVLVVGLTRLTDLYIRSAAEFAPHSLRVAGLLGQKEKYIGSSVHQHTVLGIPEDVAEIVRTLEVHGVFIDCIVVAKRFESLSEQAQQALLQLESSTSIKLEFLVENLGLEDNGRGSAAQTWGDGDAEGSAAAFSYSPEALEALNARLYWPVKRAIDMAAALVLLGIAAPVMAIVALFVAIDVGLPVTFWQQRPGRGGHPIHLYKFRTMVSAHDSKGRRIPDDKRLSLIGKFLRRTRLDELPQLFSILSGEMSFVGPRPLLPIDQPPEFAARLLVPPGLTGWAQVSGGREVSAADKAALDVWYVQNASLLLDLRIILRTIPMIVLGERMSTRDIQRAWRELQDAGICPPRETTPNFTTVAGSREAA